MRIFFSLSTRAPPCLKCAAFLMRRLLFRTSRFAADVYPVLQNAAASLRKQEGRAAAPGKERADLAFPLFSVSDHLACCPQFFNIKKDPAQIWHPAAPNLAGSFRLYARAGRANQLTRQSYSIFHRARPCNRNYIFIPYALSIRFFALWAAFFALPAEFFSFSGTFSPPRHRTAHSGSEKFGDKTVMPHGRPR